jgi:hypothetical protein
MKIVVAERIDVDRSRMFRGRSVVKKLATRENVGVDEIEETVLVLCP